MTALEPSPSSAPSAASADRTDVAVVGGGPAGLQAALTVARVHRRVTLFDDGRYRNAAASHIHNVATHDGTPPPDFRAVARAELARYETFELREAAVTEIEADDDGVRLTTGDGQVLHAGAVVLATGVRDELPEVPGLSELWGDLVAHCPFCHGHEAAGGRIGILGGAAAPHLSRLLEPIASELVVLPHTDPAPEGLPDGTQVRPGAVQRVERGSGDGAGGEQVVVTLEDGSSERLAALFVVPTMVQSAPFAAQLGLTLNDSGCVRVDEMGATSRPRVFAAGDLAHRPTLPMPMSTVVQAMAAGQQGGSGALMSLMAHA